MLPPGPSEIPLIQFLNFSVHPFRYLDACSREFGEQFTLRLMGYGDFVVFSNPKDVEAIFTGSPNILHSGETISKVFQVIFGPHSVVILDGEPHKEQRQLLMPPFHGEGIRVHVATIAQTCETMFGSWPKSRRIRLSSYIRNVTLDIILKTIFGVTGEETGVLRKVFARFLKNLLHPVSIVAMELPRWFSKSGAQWLFPVRRLRTVDREIHRLIQERRTNPELPSLNDVLSILLRAVHDDGSPMTDPEVRDELLTLLIAGTESTTVAIEWALRDILAHPPVYEKVCGEILATTNGKSVSADDLGNLKFLDAAITESLRLHPVIPWVARKLTADFQVRGTTFPKGTVLSPSIYLVHRRPDLYPDPGQFKPQRFLSKKLDPFTWFPFGGSNRRCIGMALAIVEMKVILATLFQRFQMTLLRPPAQVKPVRRGLLWAPSDSAQVVIEAGDRT